MARPEVLMLLAILAIAHGAPEQIHLSLTAKSTEMTVMWTTASDTKTSTVYYWSEGGPNMTATASPPGKHYQFPPNYVSPAIHTVTMTQLAPDTKYFYTVGDEDDGFSDVFTFNSVPSKPPVPLRIAHIADHGTTNYSAGIVEALVKEHTASPYAFLLLSGDISYANGVQPVWDQWGNMAQPAATLFPWMTAIGNHELLDLYLAYINRFSMPTNGFLDLWYSFDYSLVHVIALSSEDIEYGTVDPQMEWLKNDLKNVNRQVTPWILAIWHNPWYCSNTNHQGAGTKMRDAYEDLFYDYHVDLVINGHVHAYERSLPVYKGNVTEDATVYITAGVGGNKEGLYNNWETPTPAWSAHHEAHWGYGTISVYNASHLHWELKRLNDTVVDDEVWLVKNR